MTGMLGQVGGLFAAPWLAAAGAAAMAVPVAIHLLSRIRRRQEPWGAMRFLLAAYRRQKRRLHMEQWLLLAVRCLLVLLLGLALAGPMMGGFVGQWAGGLDQRGRVVHLVVDDALSSQATDGDAAGDNRFSQLRDKALGLIQALAPNDRLALWRSSRPAVAMVSPATRDQQAGRDQREAREPRFSRPDLGGTLGAVAEQLDKQQVTPDRGRVIVLSDLARADGRFRQPPGEAARRLADHATLLITEPTPATANAQIQRLAPRRPLVLAPAGSTASVPLTVELRRFADSANRDDQTLAVSLMSLEGQSLASRERTVRWQRGQESQAINLTLTRDQAGSIPGDGGRPWLIQAQLQAPVSANRLAADDTAWTHVTARNHLNIGLIGTGPSAGPEERLSPDQWLRLAMAPQGVAETGPLRPRVVEPGRLGGAEQPLQSLDAALVVRPDRLNDAGWAALADFARAGGLVWVMTPPRQGAGRWIGPMRSVFELDWQLAMEAEQVGDAEPRQLDVDQPTPTALSRLAADWQALLRPVRVTRWLPMQVPAGQRWLALRQDGAGEAQAGENASRPALLASKPIGAGRLVVLGTALSSQWTNLPTKPLMVPLLQETLRGAVGQRPPSLVVGDRPTLSRDWQDINELRRIDLSGQADADTTSRHRLALQSDATGARPTQAFGQPGVYRASNRGQVLTVNADPKGGDTRATDRQRLTDWLDQLMPGEGWQFLPADQPEQALQQDIQRAQLGWPLLWAVLALAVCELLLARHFAHAQRLDRLPARQRLMHLWRRLRYHA
jgi:hypothetical protein